MLFLFPVLIIFVILAVYFRKSITKEVFFVIVWVIVAWSLIFPLIIRTFNLFTDNIEYKFKEPSLITVCKNGGEILSADYWTNLDDKNNFVYYKTSDNKIISLNTSIGEEFIEKNPKWNLEKNKYNSNINSFPSLEFMQNKMEYSIVNQELFDRNSKTIKKSLSELNTAQVQDEKKKYGVGWFYAEEFKSSEATYINPEKVTKEEFNTIVECAKNIENNVSVLVYQKPNIKRLKAPIDYYRESFFSELSCQNDGLLLIQNTGVVTSGYYAKNSRGEYLIEEKLSIGYYNLTGEFIRGKDIESDFSYTQKSPNHSLTIPFTKIGIKIPTESTKSYWFSEVGFPVAYQNSQTLKLLFNENQEPIDDYLKTCKNQDGKTIFDIFKED